MIKINQSDEQSQKEAFEYFRKAAFLNHGGARFQTGLCYYHGIGTPKSLKEAYLYFYTAATLNHHAEAQRMVANMLAEAQEFGNANDLNCGTDYCDQRAKRWFIHINSQNDRQIVKWYTKAAYDGDIKSQYMLGSIYYNGLFSTKVDFRKAIGFYLMAANNHDSDALFKLGKLSLMDKHREVLKFSLNDFIEVEDVLAIPYKLNAALFFMIGANKGNPECMMELGKCLWNQIGVERDIDWAGEMYRRAVIQKMINNLDLINKPENINNADFKEKIKRSGLKSVADSFRELGWMHMLGMSQLNHDINKNSEKSSKIDDTILAYTLFCLAYEYYDDQFSQKMEIRKTINFMREKYPECNRFKLPLDINELLDAMAKYDTQEPLLKKVIIYRQKMN